MHDVFYIAPEFWVAVAFMIVVGSAFRRLTRVIGTVLDTRAEKIKARLNEARRLREEAQHLLVEYQRRQRGAFKETEDIIAHAMAKAKRQKEEALAKFEEVTRRCETQALERITQAEIQATTEIRNLVVDVAVAAARRLIVQHLDQEQAKLSVDRNIQKFPIYFQKN